MLTAIVIYVIAWAACGALLWRRWWSGSVIAPTRRDVAECAFVAFFWPGMLPVVVIAIVLDDDGWNRWWNTPIGRKEDR